MNGDVNHNDESVSIQLNIEELVTLALQLREVPTLEIELESVPVAPPLEQLRRLRLESGDGDVAVHLAGDTVTLSGSAEAREWLARELIEILNWNDWNEPGMHAHFDAGQDQMALDGRNLTVWGPAG
jgi:hypothetical protein